MFNGSSDEKGVFLNWHFPEGGGGWSNSYCTHTFVNRFERHERRLRRTFKKVMILKMLMQTLSS